jgi:hypothetical protein
MPGQAVASVSGDLFFFALEALAMRSGRRRRDKIREVEKKIPFLRNVGYHVLMTSKQGQPLFSRFRSPGNGRPRP